MSSFSADWLALRERHDHAARSASVLGELAAWASTGRGARRALDLGSGTGSTLRALAPVVPALRDWTLAEHDPGLIASGGRILVAQPETAALRWRYAELDLAPGVPDALLDGVDLVTASALIDLVSAAWLERLVRAVRQHRVATYVALSYDGRIAWTPVDPDDGLVHRLFDRHQRSDKGFGPALGPAAASTLERALAALAGRTVSAASDWLLGPDDTAIQAAMVDSLAAAARAVDPLAAALIDAWSGRRRALIAAGSSTLRVGHRDVLYRPPATRTA